MVTLDSLIGDRQVTGLKVDVKGFELGVLEGASLALRDHRIALIQLEWNGASLDATGTDRRSLAEMLTNYGYALMRPSDLGVLVATNDLDDMADMFATPAVSNVGRAAK